MSRRRRASAPCTESELRSDRSRSKAENGAHADNVSMKREHGNSRAYLVKRVVVDLELDFRPREWTANRRSVGADRGL